MKWIAWLAKWAAAALLVSALSVWTTFNLVESYMEQLLAEWSLPALEAPELDLGGLFSAASGMAEDVPAAGGRAGGSGSGPLQQDVMPDETGEPERLPSAGRDKPLGGALKVDALPDAGGIEASDPDAMTGGDIGEPGTMEPPEGDALPVFGQVILPDALVMSAEQFNDRRKNLTETDKRDMFALFFNKLPQEELQRLSLLLEDGITADEADTIMEVMTTYLEQNEVNRLLQILTQE